MHARGALVVALVLLPSAVAGQDAGRDLRLVSFTSRTFGNTRTLRILLTYGYEAPENPGSALSRPLPERRPEPLRRGDVDLHRPRVVRRRDRAGVDRGRPHPADRRRGDRTR